jgi:hypothetical protein
MAKSWNFALIQIQERERLNNVNVNLSRFLISRISEEQIDRNYNRRLSGTGRNVDQGIPGPIMMNEQRLTGRVNFGSNFEEIQI